ncbi:alpha/beta hydrolase [Sphingomonas sp. ID0503]|uniref:alpha/beta hydrolase n=1 Tax=Sphingomonas sp. ID0503 TaxID=3399691 RepID=UPI003AFB4FF7
MTDASALALVADDLKDTLLALPDLGALDAEGLPGVRAMIAGTPPVLGLSDGVELAEVSIPGADGGQVPALLYRPADRGGAAPALLNIHGGGYVAGTAQREDATARLFARALQCVVLSPDYRLAPEHPYPAALHDCQAALRWLRESGFVDPTRIAMRGVSAGGGLALGLALLERDEGAPPISHLHLLYPMLDDRTGEHPHNGRYVWNAAANRFGWASLLAGQDRAAPPPYAVPGRAADVSGLPPVFLAVGAIDLFADEALALASRLMAAGVPVEMHLYPGAYHGFNLVEGSASATALHRDGLAALARAFEE